MMVVEALEPLLGWAAKSCVMTESVGEGVAPGFSSKPPTSNHDTRLPQRGLGIGSGISSAAIERSCSWNVLISSSGNLQLLFMREPGCLVDDRRSRSATGAG